MKKQLYIYGILIIIFIIYNQFFQVSDPRINTAINILFGSILFLYIAYMAYLVIKNMKSDDKNQ